MTAHGPGTTAALEALSEWISGASDPHNALPDGVDRFIVRDAAVALRQVLEHHAGTRPAETERMAEAIAGLLAPILAMAGMAGGAGGMFDLPKGEIEAETEATDGNG
jgi:hypothetical protein